MQYGLERYDYPGLCAFLMYKRDLLTFDLSGHRFMPEDMESEHLKSIIDNANTALDMVHEKEQNAFFLIMQKAKSVINPLMSFSDFFNKDSFAYDIAYWFKNTDLILRLIRTCEVTTSENSKLDPVFAKFFAAQITALGVVSQMVMPLTSEFELLHAGTSKATKSGMIIKYVADQNIPIAWKYLRQLINDFTIESFKVYYKGNGDVDDDFLDIIFKRYIAQLLFHIPCSRVVKYDRDNYFIVDADKLYNAIAIHVSRLVKEKLHDSK